MFCDFEILKIITSPTTKLSIPKSSWLTALLQTLDWSFTEKFSLKKRLQSLSAEEIEIILNAVNYWRKEAKLVPLKKSSNRMFQVEIAHLARLKAFQISSTMAKMGSASDKKRWVLESLASDLFLNLSKKTFLGDECLDRILGLNERKIKTELFSQNVKALYRNEDIYLELDPEDLFTPYRVLVQLSEHLKFKPGDTLVDLGSGLGRVGIVMGLLNPKLKFIGIELMKERHLQAQKASKKLGLSKQIKFECGDLSKVPIPQAKTYYLFNPFSFLTLRKVFLALKINAQNQRFRIAMAQVGRPPRMVKSQSWLKQVYLSPLDRNWRAHGFSVYQNK